jgi:SAM-dependent methyltransferase
VAPVLDADIVREFVDFAYKANPTARRRWRITRFAMYKALEGRLSQYDAPDRNCLSISHSNALAMFTGLRSVEIVSADYPDHNLLSLPFENESMDFLVADQVLEHVEGDPYQAISETARVLKVKGFAVHTTCMINPLHMEPLDFWRFTHHALRMLTEGSGFEVVECAGWGNRHVWVLVDMGFRKVLIPEDEENPLYKLATLNERHHPIVTWVIARKPM